MTLTAEEVRVLGCLIEKELTTPEYYPLSVNALALACNQKTNRDPVMNLEDPQVTGALERLRQAGLALRSAEGSRVARYAHNVKAKLCLDVEELAVLCVLLLRGPQTAGEVRSRVERMHAFPGLPEVEAVLERLMAGDAPIVARLERLPGRKEHRYGQLLGGIPRAEQQGSPPVGPLSEVVTLDERVERLEEEVASLRAELAALAEELREFKGQFNG